MSNPYVIHTMELGPMENFIYLIEDTKTNTAAVVDPAWEPRQILKKAESLGVRITDILLTHSHHDHVNGVQAVLDRYDAQLHLLKDEAGFWGHYLDLPTLHHGGDRIAIGNTEIDILHTPGHTPGSACYQVGDNLIAGDTLFVFGCGRCDLSGGDPETMFSTLKDLTQRLDSKTIVLPGHNYADREQSTMEEQIAGNPFLHFSNKQDFVHYRMHFHDKHRDSPYGPVKRGDELIVQ